jgi:hypothetical protein
MLIYEPTCLKQNNDIILHLTLKEAKALDALIKEAVEAKKPRKGTLKEKLAKYIVEQLPIW